MPGTKRRLIVLLVVAALLAVALCVKPLFRGGSLAAHALAGDPGRRIEAIHKMADGGDSGDVEMLFGIVQDPDTRVAVEVCRSLSRVQRPSNPINLDTSRLVAATDDPRPQVREAAVVAVGAIGPNSSVGVLLEKLRNDPSPDVQAAAADALGRRRALDAMPALLDLLDSPSLQVRRSAAFAITSVWMRDYGFNPDDPPGKRRELAKGMRAAWDWYVQGPAYPYLKAKLEKQP